MVHLNVELITALIIMAKDYSLFDWKKKTSIFCTTALVLALGCCLTALQKRFCR